MLDIVSLQNEDGSFSGDMWGEVDTRYLSSLSFLVFWKIKLICAYCLFDLNLPNSVSGSHILLFYVYRYYIVWIKLMWRRLRNTF